MVLVRLRPAAQVAGIAREEFGPHPPHGQKGVVGRSGMFPGQFREEGADLFRDPLVHLLQPGDSLRRT